MNKLLATERGFLKILVGTSSIGKIRNFVIRKIISVKDKPDITDNRRF
jgi:hypothetical protein